jgi:hypothetical protein
MANQQITNSEATSEFITANYKTSLWGLREWTAALTIRSSIRKTWRLVCFEGKRKKDVPDHILSFVLKAAREILSNPLDCDLDVSLFNSKRSNNPIRIIPIRDQSPADYFSGVHKYKQDRRYLKWVNRDIFIENENYVYGDDENHVYDEHNKKLAGEDQKYYGTSAWKMHEECSENGFDIGVHSLFIAVDLRASNSELELEFKKWLQNTRKEIGITPKNRKFDRVDFDDWHTDRLLQYLDLTFWWEVNNINYTNNEICNKIFPKGDVDEYHVGKTTRKNALKVISDEYILALNNQLHLQIKEQKQNK